jgi:hypothetical protein
VVAPVILSVVAFIAGHPTSVVCDEQLGGLAVAGAVARTPFGGNVIYALPRICDDTAAVPGTQQFALGVGTFIHEAAHARGYRLESCAEMIADIGIYQVLRDFYGIPFFTPKSESIATQVFRQTRGLPESYQPELCWARGSPA